MLWLAAALLILLIGIIHRALLNQLRIIDRKNSHDLENMNFREMIESLDRHRGKYTKEDFESAEKSSEKMVGFSNEFLQQSLNKMTEHLILINGGASSLATTLLVANVFNNLNQKYLFLISWTFFLVSLCLSILSFYQRIVIQANFLQANSHGNQISEMFRELGFRIKNNSFDEPYRLKVLADFDFHWEELRNEMKNGKMYDVYAVSSIQLSIASAVSGVIMFLIFGLINFS